MSKQGTEEWFAERRGKVTASVAGAILGLSPYQTPDDVMRAMVRDYLGAEPEFTGNVATHWGLDHEKDAIAALENKYGELVTPCGAITHPEHEWLCASPDGLMSGVPVEVKCPYNRKLFSLSDRQDYYAQVQIQMFCTSSDSGVFGVWTPDDFYSEAVLFDQSWGTEQFDSLRSFHADFLTIVNDPELSAPFLEDLVQDMDGIAEWSTLSKLYLLKKAEAEKAAAEVKQVKDMLIEAANGRKSSGGGVLVYPVKGKTSTDYKALLKDNPNIDAADYMKTGQQSWAVRVN